MFERVALELAWPIVALITLPFIIWKFNELIAAIKNAKSLSDRLPQIVEAFESFKDGNKQFRMLNEQLVEQKEKIISEIRFSVEAKEINELEESIVEGLIDQPGLDAEQAAVPKADKMLQNVIDSWSRLTTALDGVCEQVKREKPDQTDKRSFGKTVRKLADGRRKNPLEGNDVELITSLHGLFKRYVWVQRNIGNYLDKEKCDRFETSVNRAIEKINRFSNSN